MAHLRLLSDVLQGNSHAQVGVITGRVTPAQVRG